MAGLSWRTSARKNSCGKHRVHLIGKWDALSLQTPARAIRQRYACQACNSDAVGESVSVSSSNLVLKRTKDTGITYTDDLNDLMKVLPPDVSAPLLEHPDRPDLVEVILDLGRVPQARFMTSVETLSSRLVSRDDLAAAVDALGDFGTDNRAGIEGTLHRISALRNRAGAIVGLTCRVGRAVTGHVEMIRDLLDEGRSILFLGRPGIGKTTVIRELARTLADDHGKRVVIVDTSNEIGGDGDVPHPAVGGARRMQVPNARQQHDIMIEAVENHMPEVIIVDEVGTAAEALACRTIAERGVTLIATAHGTVLDNLMNNPMLVDLIGGVESVTLGDDTARERNCQKSVLERRAPSTFPVLVEMRTRSLWVQHDVEESVDALLLGDLPYVKIRSRDMDTNTVSSRTALYNEAEVSPSPPHSPPPSASASAASSHPADPAALNEQYSTEFDADLLASQPALSSSGVPFTNESFEGGKIPSGWAEQLEELDDVGVLTALSRHLGADTAAMSRKSRRRAAAQQAKVDAAERRRSRGDGGAGFNTPSTF